MWPCKSIDLSWDDWMFALEVALDGGDREMAAARVEVLWGAERQILATLTARSAFDLFLRAVAWEPGDEVIFSAVNVPEMAEIARAHGLVPVPLDIDPMTTAPDPAKLESLIGPRSRGLVIAHLFGARLELGPTLDVAHAHGLAVVEDCAEAYAGPEWSGHPEADVSLFSFGPMKTATALGGGAARVSDPELFARMRALADEDPVQSSDEYLRRVLMFGLMKAASNPAIFGLLTMLVEATGRDAEALLHRLTRSIPDGVVVERVRRRPCAGNLRLMERRIAEMARPIVRRTVKGDLLHEALGPLVDAPTRGSAPHSYWMVPVLFGDRARLERTLRSAGFFAMSPRFEVVEAPPGRALPDAGARRVVEDGLCIPFDPDMPDDELLRLAEIVRTAPPSRDRRLLAAPEPTPDG